MAKNIGVPPMAELPSPEKIDEEGILRSYMDGEIDLICVLGPTASGKTRYAVGLAERIGRMTLMEQRPNPLKSLNIAACFCAI